MKGHNWHIALAQEIEAARERPWAWGAHDCLQFAARIVQAMTGIDYAARFGDYDSEAGALQVLAVHGSVSALISSMLAEIPPAFAGRGDVVTAELDLGETAGVCIGNACAFAQAPRGVAFRPRTCIVKAWRV